jgi:4-amino-4-deoxy-L-arabinose transferase-like glycosyltransferase
LKDRSTFITTFLLLLIVLFALGLRLYRLDAQSLWYDEGFSVYLARMDLDQLTARTAADIQPPLYYYLLHSWIGLFGESEAALRGLSVLFGILTVPLIYAMAWRLFRSRLAGLLAALLVAVSPLHIWYGQEARMYTLLTFLCLLSSYIMLLVIQAKSRGTEVALWIAFSLTSIAAVYTHYFAFFILVFQALYLLLVWLGRGLRPSRLLLGGAASAVVIWLAYIPWLPHLLSRLGADVSYWPGRLKLDEIFVDVALSFVGGESIPEAVGVVLALGYGLALVGCVIALVVNAGRAERPPDMATEYPTVFLLLYLVLPVALILALSFSSPKFNARYAMVSHPALVLVLAGGLAALWQRRGSYLVALARGTLAFLILIFVLGVSAYANYNAYADPAFARADFRGVARHLQENMAADEVVLLVSGHMFPVFDYYARDVERYRLPDSPTLDTTRTLDYGIARQLNEWLANKGGVWVVLWQDEVVDPVGYVASMLDSVGQEQPVGRTFPQVGLRHYRLPADAQFSAEPDIEHPTTANFGNQLRLLGYSQSGEQQVTLFWQALQPLNEDYRVSLVFRDPSGQSWGRWDGRPSSYLYPTDRWREGQVVPGRYDLALLPGSPPGDYGLEVGVYTEADPEGLDLLDEAGAPQGKRAVLGDVRLPGSPITPDQLDVPHPGRTDMGGGLSLLGWDLDRSEGQAGDRLLLTLAWLVDSQPGAEYMVQVWVTDATGQMLDAGVHPPTIESHPTGDWQKGQAWRGQSMIRLPIEAQPGEAHLSIQLVDTSGAAVGPVVDLAPVQILPTDRDFEVPEPQVLLGADFAGKITLVGADVDPDPVAPGSVLQVVLFWQAQTGMDVPYTVFVHLLGPDGRLIAGDDGQPVDGIRPTTGWVSGEYITDPHQLQLPPDLSPGEYVLEVGLYDAEEVDLPRLPVVGQEGQAETDKVIVGPIQVQ